MSVSGNAHRRLRANEQVFAHRLDQTRVSRQVVATNLKAVPSRWFVFGGLAAGFVAGRLPAHTIAAAVGALAAFSLRLLNTPLGPMAIGAVMTRRKRQSRSDLEHDDRPDAEGR